MKIVLLGAPGSGKGTLAKRLVGEFNIPTISTGDLLRNSIKEGTALGLEAKSYMDEGKLVPTELVLDLLKERLAEKDTENGYILDGFPRSLEQAELLSKMIDVDVVLFLDVPKETIVGRVMGRRTCRECGEIYNTRTYTEERCRCGGELYQRDDDNPETVSKRFDTFASQTEPLVGFYTNKNLLKVVKGQDNPEETFKVALNAMNEETLNDNR